MAAEKKAEQLSLFDEEESEVELGEIAQLWLQILEKAGIGKEKANVCKKD